MFQKITLYLLNWFYVVYKNKPSLWNVLLKNWTLAFYNFYGNCFFGVVKRYTDKRNFNFSVGWLSVCPSSRIKLKISLTAKPMVSTLKGIHIHVKRRFWAIFLSSLKLKEEKNGCTPTPSWSKPMKARGNEISICIMCILYTWIYWQGKIWCQLKVVNKDLIYGPVRSTR